MSRIKSCFEALNKTGHKALIPYITAGDPHPDCTVQLMHTLVDAGANIIELGVPFSDPMADGPVIQAACERALIHQTNLSQVLEMVREFRDKNTYTPVVLMGYQNPIEVMGISTFSKKAHDCQVDGVLTVDMPIEQADHALYEYQKHGIDTIFLIAPTTSEKRIKSICEKSSGFIYYVSLKGVTGAGHLNVEEVKNKILQIKQFSNVPVGVGFGIKDAESAKTIALISDAVVVGSALISEIENNLENHAAMYENVKIKLMSIRQAINEVSLKQEVA